jgi:putative effector of murein hydrolase LrgA (UPF0299 family)
MSIGAVLGEGLSIYRRLWRRSILVAGLISIVVALADALAASAGTAGTQLVSLALGLIGGLLVQGALVEVVRDLHEGRGERRLAEYYDATRGRLGTLLGASIMYTLGVAFGFILLVVPGLIALARWSLIVPLVIVERLDWRAAFARSSDLVRGQTGRVLVVIILSNLLTLIASAVVGTVFAFLPSFFSTWIGGVVAGALVVPFEAHVLTVLYYKLTEPERPVLPERQARTGWRSVWDEERD